jgi:hypothetical protein
MSPTRSSRASAPAPAPVDPSIEAIVSFLSSAPTATLLRDNSSYAVLAALLPEGLSTVLDTIVNDRREPVCPGGKSATRPGAGFAYATGKTGRFAAVRAFAETRTVSGLSYKRFSAPALREAAEARYDADPILRAFVSALRARTPKFLGEDFPIETAFGRFGAEG